MEIVCGRSKTPKPCHFCGQPGSRLCDWPVGKGKTCDFKFGDYVPLGTTAEDLVRHAAFVVLADEAHEWRAFREYIKVGRAFGIDVKKLVDEAAPVEKPKPEISAPAKKAPRKKK
jgi:hypothetical protein